MSTKFHWFFIIAATGFTACAAAPKSTPIRETTAEVQVAEPVDKTSTEDSTQAPEGEISLDGAKSTEVDIGVTGTSTGPVVVDSAIKQPSVLGDAEISPELLAEALLEEAKAEEAKAAEAKGKKTKGKKTNETPEDTGKIIIENGDETKPELIAP